MAAIGRYRLALSRSPKCHACGRRGPLAWRVHRPEEDPFWVWVWFAGPLVVEKWHSRAALREFLEETP